VSQPEASGTSVTAAPDSTAAVAAPDGTAAVAAPDGTAALAAPDSTAALAAPDSTAAQTAPGGTAAGRPGGRGTPLLGRSWVTELLVVVGFLAAGVAADWPRATYITGSMPMDARQAPLDIWSLWWVASQITHLGNPWFTTHLAAPVGIRLGLDTLMPLVGLVMAPVTLLFGPSASYNLLGIVTPGLACYAMYRVARLWLPSRTGAIAAGAFYGLSAMLSSQVWEHLHTAIGAAFLPLTLETAVRLRRDPGTGRAILLGLVVGACMLVDQEAAILAALLAAVALVPWLVSRPGVESLRATAVGAVTALAVASPQLLAMVQASGRGGPQKPPVANYVHFAAELPSIFAPSPRLATDGLSGLGSIYTSHRTFELIATFGTVLSVLAVVGLVAHWRRHGSRGLALLWLGGALFALGPTLYIGSRQFIPAPAYWRGIRVSLLMPYSWLIRLPGLASFREADRFALLGLVGAALLAGAGVDWLRRRRAWPVIIVVALLGGLEAGWPGDAGQPVMPTALPAVDRPIAADHSGSVVVDVPFVVRGPEVYGSPVSPFPLVLATADGHPRAMSYTAMVPTRTIAGISRHPFYAGLVDAQSGAKISPALLAAARLDLRKLDVGWLILWPPRWALAVYPAASRPDEHYPQIRRYLAETGFAPDYRADGVTVYRPRGTTGSR